MNFAAYGLSQGMAGQNQGNQLINAMNTASLIQYRRDQQRLQNRYADIAQQNADLEAEKWGMDSKLKQQELEKKIFELEQQQNQASGTNFARVTVGAVDSQDATAMNNLIQKDSRIKKLADMAGVVGFSFFNQYSDEELRKLGVAEGMNPREYMITLNANGTKSLISARNLMAMMGVGNLFSQAQIQSVFDQQRYSNLNKLWAVPTTEEGVKQAKLIADLNTQAEKINNPAVDVEGKASVAKPSSTEMKMLQTSNIQALLDSLPSTEDQKVFDKTAIEVMNNGNDEQKLTAAQAWIGRAVSQGVNLDKIADSQIGSQSMNVLYSSLSNPEQTQYKELMELMRTNAKLSSSMSYLSRKDTLGKFMNDTTIASADTWASKILNKVMPDIKKDVAGFQNDVVRQKYQNVLNTMIKAISGSAVSAQEAERLKQELGDLATESGVNALIGLRNLAENLVAELGVFNNSPSLRIFVKPQMDLFQSIINGLDETGEKFNIPKSSVGQTQTQTLTPNANQPQVTNSAQTQSNKEWLKQQLQGAR